jgi:hydrogenase expression/formation protein HypE
MNDPATAQVGLACPVSLSRYPAVTLAHGGGGRLMGSLIEEMFLHAFANPILGERHDSAELPLRTFAPGIPRLAMTTDSFVVRPLVFPGGDIGVLGVYGTVNDLAMIGATPRWMSTGFILEEGLPMETLWAIVQSIAHATRRCDVSIVTGDTKVVERGKGDGLYLNTTGVGIIEHTLTIAPRSVRVGDHVIVNGDIGRHGMAILASREGLGFESSIESDCAPLHEATLALVRSGVAVHCLRDLTRGGLAAATHEIAAVAGVTIELDEEAIPVSEEVRSACEILGLDPTHVACEGRFMAWVPSEDSSRALATLRAYGPSHLVGRVVDRQETPVVVRTAYGRERPLDLPSGEQLPRIC